PPAPPGINATIAIKGARNLTSFHGSFLNQPSNPFPPFLRPARSNVANIANAVIKDGSAIDRLMKTCMNLIPSVMEGSTIWWWNPPGIFRTTAKITTRRAKASLNNFPSITFGTATYHAETAAKYQTLTAVCPKLQNNVLLNITLIVSVQPNAQGMSMNTSIV